MNRLLIDGRFLLEADTHLITDKKTSVATRLEPRLVTLLLLLSANPGGLVTRDQIIRDIWDDYGGGEDGLNQAISFLRKTLDDAAKNRIRTIPKKGYLLNATVSAAPENEIISTAGSSSSLRDELPGNPRSSRLKAMVLSLIVLLIVVLLILGKNVFSPAAPESREPGGAVEDTLYQYEEMKQQQRSIITDSI